MTGRVVGLSDGLFDDAALCPPGDAPMPAAVPALRQLRTRLGGPVGPFVVPAVRLHQLGPELADGDQVPVSLIAPAGDLPGAQLTRARAAFTFVGTCSGLEPIGDLVGLGLLPAQERVPA
jgi:hypothetical protein